MPKRRLTKSRKYTISDDAKRIWSDGGSRRVCIDPDGSGIIVCSKLAVALNRLELIKMPRMRELILELEKH